MKRSVDNTRLRFGIRYTDTTKAGTMLTDTDLNYDEGVHDIYATLDLSHIMPGQYSVNIVAYQYSQLGTQLLLDQLFPAFYFEIRESIDEANHIIWKHDHYGHNRLHDVQIHE